MKVFIGWDPVDVDAYRVCRDSLLRHSSIELEIQPVMDHLVRKQGIYWRPYHVNRTGQKWDITDGKPFSTGFSFTRFCVPQMAGYADEWVLFMDPDMLVRADIAGLLDQAGDKALYCVQHDYVPRETMKMGGFLQTQYARKNWSSLMLLNPSRNTALTPFNVNNQTGSWLHAMLWLSDDEIGALDESWNWLEGHSSPAIEPKIIHYTRGTPDLVPTVDKADLWWNEFHGGIPVPVMGKIA
jgi:hypothetical protein